MLRGKNTVFFFPETCAERNRKNTRTIRSREHRLEHERLKTGMVAILHGQQRIGTLLFRV